jgi:hypothetical protein
MSTIIFVILTVICWQPIYLGAMMAYHTFKGETVDRAAYSTAFSVWFGKLWSLVFSKPGV